MKPFARESRKNGPIAQFGIVLFTVLIALVVISLSAVALIRSVDTGTVIAGNLAFRQASTQAADGGVEAAFSWLKAKVDSDVKELYKNDPANGYYATWMAGCDLGGTETPDDLGDDVIWGDSAADDVEPEVSSCTMKPAAVSAAVLPLGYAASYVVNRLCLKEGSPDEAGNSCEKYYEWGASADAGVSKLGPSYQPPSSLGPARYFYRVTTRVVGPRNTVSFVQVMLLN